MIINRESRQYNSHPYSHLVLMLSSVQSFLPAEIVSSLQPWMQTFSWLWGLNLWTTVHFFIHLLCTADAASTHSAAHRWRWSRIIDYIDYIMDLYLVIWFKLFSNGNIRKKMWTLLHSFHQHLHLMQLILLQEENKQKAGPAPTEEWETWSVQNFLK